MDLTIVNLAIPSIRADLTATAAHAQWTIAIYALGVASLQLLGGEAGDRFGRRRVLQIGTTIFVLGSLLCSLAPTIDVLIAARLMQAVGASMMNPVALAIISQFFVAPAERARAIGIWGAVFGAALAQSPLWARSERDGHTVVRYSLNAAGLAADMSSICAHWAAISSTVGTSPKVTPSFWNSAAR